MGTTRCNRQSRSDCNPGRLRSETGSRWCSTDRNYRRCNREEWWHPRRSQFWSRDPDGTQHNQGDSLNKLSPGINGPTSKAAVRNADDNLRQILEFVESTPGLGDDTDIFLNSDHGFSTISRHVYYFDSAGFEGRTVGLSGGE